MGLPIGTTNNPNGRPQGSKNKRSLQWEDFGEKLIEQHTPKFNSLLSELWNGTKEERFLAANLYLKTLEYFKPKIARSLIVVDEDSNSNSTCRIRVDNNPENDIIL